MTTKESAIARQRNLERDMRQRGFAKAVHRLSKDGDYDAREFRGLIGPYINSVSDQLAETCLQAIAKPGRPNIGVKVLLLVEPEKSASITLDLSITALTRRTTLLKLALQIGRSIETQHKLERYEQHDKPKFNWLYKEAIRRSTNSARVRYGLLHAMKLDGLNPRGWTKEECMAAGFVCLEALISSTGLIELERVYQSKRYTTYIKATEKAGLLMTDMIANKISACTQYGPLVCPPDPWHVEGDKYVGAYYTPEIQIPFVKTKSRDFKKRITQHDMDEHVEAANVLMSTAYKIDYEALCFAQHLVDTQDSLLPLDEKTVPDRYEGDDPEELKRWKAEARDAYAWNAKLEGKRFQILQILQTAWEYQMEPSIWFAVNCDFRGRFNYYTGGSLLNPQGSDLSKSLICFKQGSRIEGEGEDWFLIHGANEFGVKGTLSERHHWSCQNHDLIVASARQPMEFDWWRQADHPLCFLRWCREFDKYHQSEGDYETHIPIHMDGSCNGIQHLAAMTKDSKAAMAVNMLPTDQPQDMYQIVADLIKDKMASMTDPVDIQYALLWLRFGFDRKLTKRQCMTKSYGSTQRSCTEYTKDYVLTEIEAGKPDVFGEFRQGAIIWMSQMIWNAINELVTGPQETMDWLKAVARLYNKHGKVMEWRTPTGFLVHHYYPEWKSRQVKCYIEGKEVKPRVREEQHGTVSKTEVTNGISANYVHSFDAAHLAAVILRLRDSGCKATWAIHDSIGVPPSAAATLYRVVREEFIRLYDGSTPLNRLAKQAAHDLPWEDIPPVPDMGDLDLNDILEARYFFS